MLDVELDPYPDGLPGSAVAMLLKPRRASAASLKVACILKVWMKCNEVTLGESVRARVAMLGFCRLEGLSADEETVS